ncbi:MAG: TerB family tellurite resistance protein [Hyphomonadaceae bacterium]
MRRFILLFCAVSTPAWADTAPPQSGNGALALFVLVIAIAAWLGLRSLVRGLRAGKTQAKIGADFRDYALAALVNAAKIDGRVNAQEKDAIARAMTELGGPVEGDAVEQAFAAASLSKDELVAYLAAKSGVFGREQKVALLKALMSVFVADGKFDETEHAALVEYTAAVGFDRQSAPDMLRGLARDFQRGTIT